MSKVEQVARVLEPQAWAALGIGDTLAYKNRRTSSLRKARAAIEAMREPTEAMAEAGCKDQPWGYGISDAMQTWSSMISAALSEQEQV